MKFIDVREQRADTPVSFRPTKTNMAYILPLMARSGDNNATVMNRIVREHKLTAEQAALAAKAQKERLRELEEQEILRKNEQAQAQEPGLMEQTGKFARKLANGALLRLL